MARELYQHEPAFRQALDRCAGVRDPRTGCPLFRLPLEPGGVLDGPRERLLSLFALQTALAQMWQAWGVEPDLLLGHGPGHYAAACVAGVFSPEHGMLLLARRADLLGQQTADALTALFASREEVEEVLAQWPSLTLAADNGTHQVIRGPADEVAAVEHEFRRRGLPARRVGETPTWPCDALDAFEASAGAIAFGPAVKPLVCGLTGKLLSGRPVLDAAYWRRHACAPVEWCRGVRSLAEAGCGALLEIGPDPALLGLAACCWPESATPPALIPSLRRGVPDTAAVGEALARLYVSGVSPDFASIHRPGSAGKLALPTYPFQRQRYWVETVSMRAQST
jgi:acyl transferase domain-containing protein